MSESKKPKAESKASEKGEDAKRFDISGPAIKFEKCYLRLFTFLVLIAGTAHWGARAIAEAPTADLVILDAEVITVDDTRPRAEAIAVYTEKGHAARPFFDLILKYTISEDGRLHGEKFFHTVTEEYATTRPAFRGRQLAALARVTASAYGFNRQDKHGFRAPGYEDACRLLKVKA